MTPSDHNQAEYVRGIAAGKRIERQNTTARLISRDAAFLCLGAIVGLLLAAYV